MERKAGKASLRFLSYEGEDLIAAESLFG